MNEICTAGMASPGRNDRLPPSSRGVTCTGTDDCDTGQSKARTRASRFWARNVREDRRRNASEGDRRALALDVDGDRDGAGDRGSRPAITESPKTHPRAQPWLLVTMMARARDDASPTARRSPALASMMPSMMHKTGARSPRATRSSRQPFHLANDSPPHSSRASRCLRPRRGHRRRPADRHPDYLPALRAQGKAPDRSQLPLHSTDRVRLNP